MAILQGNTADLAPRQAIVLDMGHLRRQGELVLQHACEEAARIVAAAQAERLRLISTATAQGRTEGLAQGMTEGRRQGTDLGNHAALQAKQQVLDELCDRWSGALDNFMDARQKLLDDAQREIVGFAIAVAGNIAKRTIEIDPTIAVDQVAAALTLIMRPSRMVITIHPDDRDLVAAALPSLLAKLGPAAHAQLRDDPSLGRASCIIDLTDAQGGQVDASISTQLERLTDLLLPSRASAPTASAPLPSLSLPQAIPQALLQDPSEAEPDTTPPTP